jgi:hypothetical protein
MEDNRATNIIARHRPATVMRHLHTPLIFPLGSLIKLYRFSCRWKLLYLLWLKHLCIHVAAKSFGSKMMKDSPLASHEMMLVSPAVSTSSSILYSLAGNGSSGCLRGDDDEIDAAADPTGPPIVLSSTVQSSRSSTRSLFVSSMSSMGMGRHRSPYGMRGSIATTVWGVTEEDLLIWREWG